jgi:hypothetical protein
MNELLKRHETLEENRRKLEEEKRKLESKVEEDKTGYLVIQKEKSNQILLLNNEISQLQQRKEILEQDRAQREMSLEGNDKGTFEENIFLGKIFMAIDNLASRCHEVNNQIKVVKEKKGAGGQEKVVVKKEGGGGGKGDKGGDKEGGDGGDEGMNQLLSVGAAVKKLGVVSDGVSDLLDIVNDRGRKEKGKKVYGAR